MNVYIILTTAGTDTGPFDLYSDVDGFATAFETAVSKASLVAGYSTTAPDGSTQIKVVSTGNCTNSVIIDIGVCATTTTTTTIVSTTTTTTTIVSTTTTSTTAVITTTTTTTPSITTTTTTILTTIYYKIFQCYLEQDRIMEKGLTSYTIGDPIRFSYIAGGDPRHYCGHVIDDNWLTGPADVILESPPPEDCDSQDCYGTP